MTVMQRRIARTALGLVFLAAAIYGMWLAAQYLPLREWVEASRSRWWSPLAFVVLYVLVTLILIPPQPLSIAAVLVWGWQIGGLIELIAATIGAVLPYLLARSEARPWVEARLHGHERVRRLLNDEGFSLVLVLRLIPVIPYSIFNYIAGCSTLRLMPYLVASFIGMIPSVFVFAYFVDAVAAGVMSTGAVFVRIVVAGALLGTLVVIVRIATRKVRARLES